MSASDARPPVAGGTPFPLPFQGNRCLELSPLVAAIACRRTLSGHCQGIGEAADDKWKGSIRWHSPYHPNILAGLTEPRC